MEPASKQEKVRESILAASAQNRNMDSFREWWHFARERRAGGNAHYGFDQPASDKPAQTV